MKSIAALAQRYPDKRVLITGATSGLGEALALRFAQAGFRVGIAGRNEDKIRRTVEQVEAAGGEALAVQLEITRLEDFEAAVKQIQENWSGLDILVNNAGFIITVPAAIASREVSFLEPTSTIQAFPDASK